MNKKPHTPRSKVELLPVARDLRDEWALRDHLTLAAIRMGHGTPILLGRIAQLLMVSNFLADAGYGRDALPTLIDAQESIGRIQSRGENEGYWSPTKPAEWEPLARLLTLYDNQLARAPMHKVIRAMQRQQHATSQAQPYEERRNAKVLLAA
ncbi:hypothetical protein [Burkholderia sp. Ac-20365]|uniref:hypothetical protein n=1 Tax=Burkholderia sp. Ac-20365 TaxID=2703897 RepID=UPI00197BE6B2|nr:hypothetical protein [Burkholderia sp. Ac-20365]MBN3761323.1 hypothetical protein [Burkholderia sp. Ac-20365]